MYPWIESMSVRFVASCIFVAATFAAYNSLSGFIFTPKDIRCATTLGPHHCMARWVCRSRPEVWNPSQPWPSLGQRSVEITPNRSDTCSPNSGQCWSKTPSLFQVGHRSADLDPGLAKLGANSADLGPMGVAQKQRSASTPCWRRSASAAAKEKPHTRGRDAGGGQRCGEKDDMATVQLTSRPTRP